MAPSWNAIHLDFGNGASSNSMPGAVTLCPYKVVALRFSVDIPNLISLGTLSENGGVPAGKLT